MTTLTADDQWRSLALNLGTWEGNLSQYDPEGNLKRRQGSVLFVYTDTDDDKPKIENNEPPSFVKMRLHRCGDQRDVQITYLRGMEFASSGMVYDPHNGSMCSGATLSPVSGMVVEQMLNSCDANGNIVARARLITRFDAERLQRFSVFREQPSSLSYQIVQPTLPSSLINNDLVATDVEATLETLCGTWHGSLTRLCAKGNEIVMSSEKYIARTSVEGNEIVMEGPLGGRGIISENRRSAMFVDGVRQWRLVFLGGAVTAMSSLTVPRTGEELFVELSWLVRHNLRMRTWRRYVGSNWVDSCFVEEVRVE